MEEDYPINKTFFSSIEMRNTGKDQISVAILPRWDAVWKFVVIGTILLSLALSPTMISSFTFEDLRLYLLFILALLMLGSLFGGAGLFFQRDTIWNEESISIDTTSKIMEIYGVSFIIPDTKIHLVHYQPRFGSTPKLVEIGGITTDQKKQKVELKDHILNPILIKKVVELTGIAVLREETDLIPISEYPDSRRRYVETTVVGEIREFEVETNLMRYMREHPGSFITDILLASVFFLVILYFFEGGITFGIVIQFLSFLIFFALPLIYLTSKSQTSAFGFFAQSLFIDPMRQSITVGNLSIVIATNTRLEIRKFTDDNQEYLDSRIVTPGEEPFYLPFFRSKEFVEQMVSFLLEHVDMEITRL